MVIINDAIVSPTRTATREQTVLPRLWSPTAALFPGKDEWMDMEAAGTL